MENIWMFLQQTAAASLVALFLLILQRIFLDKLSPRWQYGVWAILAVRLLNYISELLADFVVCLAFS